MYPWHLCKSHVSSALQLALTLRNVTGFALCVNLGPEKKIWFGSLSPFVTDKILHPWSQLWNHLPRADTCFLWRATGFSGLFFQEYMWIKKKKNNKRRKHSAFSWSQKMSSRNKWQKKKGFGTSQATTLDWFYWATVVLRHFFLGTWLGKK